MQVTRRNSGQMMRFSTSETDGAKAGREAQRQRLARARYQAPVVGAP